MPARKTNTKPYTFRAKPDTIGHLQMLAKKDKMPIGAYINTILEQFISNHAYSTSAGPENTKSNFRAHEHLTWAVFRLITRISSGPISEETAKEIFTKAVLNARKALQTTAPPDSEKD